MGNMLLGTFKAVTTRETAQVLSGGARLNIADPAIGGHTVWARPSVLAHRNLLLTPDERLAKVRLDPEVEQAEWTAAPPSPCSADRAAGVAGSSEATNPLHMSN